MTIPARLRSTALLPLWNAVHGRLSSGRPVSRIRIGPLDESHREAIADLLGMDRFPAAYATVSLAALDQVLHEATDKDTRAVVALPCPVEASLAPS